MARRPTPDTRHRLHVVLKDGFRGHTVVVSVDGRKMYARSALTTDPVLGHADVLDLPVSPGPSHISVSATPGAVVGSLDVDVSLHPHLVVSLIGDGTVTFETGPIAAR